MCDKQAVVGISAQFKSVHWLTGKPRLSFVFGSPNLLCSRSLPRLILFRFMARMGKERKRKRTGLERDGEKKEAREASFSCGTLGIVKHGRDEKPPIRREIQASAAVAVLCADVVRT